MTTMTTMTTINIPSAVASRSRALSPSFAAVRTPAVLCSAVVEPTTWRDRFAVPATDLRVDAHRDLMSAAHHNSISTAAGVALATGNGAYGAAKQAAPPRGLPR